MHILGVTIVYWIIFRLLIIQRLPYHLDKTVSTFQVLILVSVILGCMLECKFIIEKLQYKNIHSFIKNMIIKIVTNLYVKPLKQLQAILLTVKAFTNILHPINRILVVLFSHYNHNIIAMVIYIFLMPRLFLTITLCLDVFILKQICLFYKTLYILIIPMIGNSLLSLIQEHSTTTLHNLEKSVVNISLDNDVYTIDIKDIALNHNEALLIFDICNFHLQALNIVSNIEDIRNSKYYMLLLFIIVIIFCECWVCAFFYILDSKELI